MTNVERKALDRALDIARLAAADPGSAAQHAAKLEALIEMVATGVRRRTSPERIVKVNFQTPSVVVAGGAVTPTDAKQVTFRESLHIIGIRAMAIANGATSDAQVLPHVTVKVLDQRNYSLFKDGDGNDAFVDLASLAESPLDPSLGPMRLLDQYVRSTEHWTIQCSSSDVAGNATYTPLVYLVAELWDEKEDPIQGSRSQGGR